jgi:type VI secretion system protein ImpG
VIPDPRFLRYYERELRFVRDLAGEFASEHARIANRFGLDQDSCADPHVEWLLDGFAFLTARVQQKFDGDYAVFTQNLLNMVYPDCLAPTPSACVVELTVAPDAQVPGEGFVVPRGTAMTARPVPGEATRCVFTTAHDVTLWPIELVSARYVGPTSVTDIGVAQPARVRAALLLTLRTRGGIPFSGIALDSLVLHLGSRDRIAHALFEAIIAHTTGLAGRAAGSRERPRRLGGREAVRRVGFDDGEALLPQSPRGYAGYRLLREYFVLPERFLFVALDGLLPLIREVRGNAVEVLLSFDAFDSALESAVTESQFMLHATPALNVFLRHAKPILPQPEDREHHVVADRVHPLDYEVYAITDVVGYDANGREAVRFQPFHGTRDGSAMASAAYYAVERRTRLLTVDENQLGTGRSSYLGGEVFLSLVEHTGGPLGEAIGRLDVETLCTNRDLPLRMPLPHGEQHFSIDIGGPAASARVIGLPSRPTNSWATTETDEGARWGDAAWRLIGLLALNYHSIVDGPDGRGADALRMLLELHSAGAPAQLARHAGSVASVATRRVTRRLPEAGPIVFGRGLEIGLELVESAFAEGSAFLLGSVLEAFFRRHVTINSFTETVLRTAERGEIIRWPSRIGSRHLV